MRPSRPVVLGVVGVVLVAAVVMLRWDMIRNNSWLRPVSEPSRPLEDKDLKEIESAIRLKLPGINAVRNIAILQGKDSTVFLKIVVPSP